MIYEISSEPNLYGSDVTRAEAQQMAMAIAVAVEKEFECDTVIVSHNNHNDDNNDNIIEISMWINNNWADIINSAADKGHIVFDLRYIIEDNAGNLWAYYGDGCHAQIQISDAPRSIIDTSWLINSNLAITREPILVSRLIATYDSDSDSFDWNLDYIGNAGAAYARLHKNDNI